MTCRGGGTRPREIIRFKSDPLGAVTSLVQPVLFLFAHGAGLSSLASRGTLPGVDFRTFIYAGVLSMSVLFTAIFSGASIVPSRESSFRPWPAWRAFPATRF